MEILKSANPDDRVSYNMAGLLNMEIADNLSKANKQFTETNINQAFLFKMAAKDTAVHTFNNDERDKLKKLENLFFKYSSLMSSSLKVENKTLYDKINSVLFFIYTKYTIMAQDLLDKYGFLGEKQKDSSKLRGHD